ncbi:MAG TPA: Do family serine endopeptidase [Acidobacteriaceae bacterium]|jgi:serine protease Do|nr:Do family serine endopeptidase [Acidobacteriaceae bacterium]
MSASTNSLVAKAKRFGLPIGLAAAALLSVPFLVCHERVHAASYAAPLDDNSVSSLVALDNAVEAVAARVTPAVVNVSVTAKVTGDQDGDGEQDGGNQQQNQIPPQLRQFFGPGFGQQGPQQPQIEHGIGSGIIVTPDGYIVTNNHVIHGATQIRVTLNDRRVLPAKLIGADPLTDLAVIKIDEKNLPCIAWGDSTKLHPGQTVLAFGNPFGNFPFTVTRGIVSALDRPNPYSTDRRKPGDFIQTDAAINPGNSGGPLVDARGELIGINTFIITGGSGAFAGAGFAIPSQIVKATTDELIKTGAIHHGYLGISMNDVTPENANFFNLPDATGAIVSQVTSDSPAGHAGLKSGDVLRELNGKKIVNGSALQVAVSQVAPGTSISIGILRDGKPETVNIKVGEFHAATEVADNSGSSAGQAGKIGVSVANLTPDVRQQLNIPAQVNGAAVESVKPGSPAEDAGISPGDVILEVNRHAVQNADNFANQVHSSPAGKDILLLVWSQGGATYRVVHPSEATQSGM